MIERDICVSAALMALLRREETVRGIAARFGVTEAQVLEWQDVFIAAGVLAVTNYRNGRRFGASSSASAEELGESLAGASFFEPFLTTTPITPTTPMPH
ncbi:aldo-keto reductase family protein [Gimesia algae]|uniref:Uncharacterized protein n=1 Tax=Gimesia algae TaxID=2527971 RepID=A0A517VF51_9PLAN|nr:hypothetical protein [Gimesia algae]QDT91634.1 hypothetical protein Pan161_32960 [Gimesia algae]